MSIWADRACNHRRHLFAAPLCASQTKWRRLINIIFHLFTALIPFLIYQRYWSQNHLRLTPTKQGLYSRAIATARGYLVRCPSLSPFVFKQYSQFQPSLEICQLTNLFRSLNAQFKMEQATHNMDKNVRDATILWTNPTLSPETLMNVGYAVSCLSVDLLQKNTNEGEHHSHSYASQTLFYGAMAYHCLRRGDWGLGRAVKIPESYASCFYQESKPQSHCRELYLDYCQRIQDAASKGQLKNLDPSVETLLLKWARPDVSIGTYKSFPGPLPTDCFVVLS